MATTAESDMDNLITKVQSLPTELYNEIHDLTFSSAFQPECTIDEDYVPPNVLQVNRKWRAALSPVFYKNTVFAVVQEGAADNSLANLSKWIKSLDPQHRKYIPGSELRIMSTLKICTHHERTSNIRRSMMTVRDYNALGHLKNSVFRQVADSLDETKRTLTVLRATRLHCRSKSVADLEVVFNWVRGSDYFGNTDVFEIDSEDELA